LPKYNFLKQLLFTPTKVSDKKKREKSKSNKKKI
jgi:hypothetical protein